MSFKIIDFCNVCQNSEAVTSCTSTSRLNIVQIKYRILLRRECYDTLLENITEMAAHVHFDKLTFIEILIQVIWYLSKFIQVSFRLNKLSNIFKKLNLNFDNNNYRKIYLVNFDRIPMLCSKPGINIRVG